MQIIEYRDWSVIHYVERGLSYPDKIEINKSHPASKTLVRKGFQSPFLQKQQGGGVDEGSTWLTVVQARPQRQGKLS